MKKVFFFRKKTPLRGTLHTGAPCFEKGRFFEKKNAPARHATHRSPLPKHAKVCQSMPKHAKEAKEAKEKKNNEI